MKTAITGALILAVIVMGVWLNLTIQEARHNRQLREMASELYEEIFAISMKYGRDPISTEAILAEMTNTVLREQVRDNKYAFHYDPAAGDIMSMMWQSGRDTPKTFAAIYKDGTIILMKRE